MGRFLLVGNMYPPHHLGGYELVWQSATRALRAAGHEARVLTTDTRLAETAGDPEDPDVHRELRWYWRDHEWPPLGPWQRLALERHNARVFDRHVAELRPDAVGWWAMGGMSLSLLERARRAGLPAVGFVHDDWMVYGPLVDRWLRAMARLGPAGPVVGRVAGIPADVDLDRCARWLFVSEATRTRARELGGLELPDSGLAHSGIDDRCFSGPAAERPWGWRLLNVGRIDSRKGLDTAIDALGHLPAEATLELVGSGDPGEERGLRDRAERAGVAARVRFGAACARGDLPARYAASDVVVFPVRWDEPWGLVPLEAMAVGRPVVATGRGGSAEYLRDGENCLLFDADDAEALAAAVRRLAAEPGLRARLRAAGFVTAAEHTERRFNERVRSELCEVAR